ncbi:hypothetical protein GCM10022295_91780 [Streptomyces osmaniensis]|uniref:Uncharacterized protein n=1 Tax=Streptomyces osmaniensis TaxID=593134 RepID=A0ABP6Z2F6_9ACTN
MRVGDDKLDAVRPRSISEHGKAGQSAPSSAVATSMSGISWCPSDVGAGRDQGVGVDDPAALAGLLGQRVHPDERIWSGVQGPVAEGCDLLVQVLGHR